MTHDIRLDSWEKYALMAANSALFCLLTVLQEKCGARKTIDRWWQKRWKK